MPRFIPFRSKPTETGKLGKKQHRKHLRLQSFLEACRDPLESKSLIRLAFKLSGEMRLESL